MRQLYASFLGLRRIAATKLSLDLQQQLSEGDQYLAVLRHDILPIIVVLLHQEFVEELEGF